MTAPGELRDPLVGSTIGQRPLDAGVWLPDGWQADTQRCQIRYDLGRFCQRGAIEFEVRGPLSQMGKRVIFAAWNEEAGTDSDRASQGFFQLRLFERGMMLRLTYRPGGRSYEGKTGALEWPDGETWVHVRAEWDTAGGDNVVWRDGAEVQRGRFNRSFDGFRWLFLGRDNYKPGTSFIPDPGLVYRNLRFEVS